MLQGTSKLVGRYRAMYIHHRRQLRRTLGRPNLEAGSVPIQASTRESITLILKLSIVAQNISEVSGVLKVCMVIVDREIVALPNVCTGWLGGGG